jgi:hypothetical protein
MANRLDTILEEEEQFNRSVAIEAKLGTETKQLRCPVIIIGFILCVILCGIAGISITKDGTVQLRVCGLTKKQQMVLEDEGCLTSEHGPTCWIKLCSKYGELECLGDRFFLTVTDVRTFVEQACDSYENRQGCELVKNTTTVLFRSDECGVICKVLL